MGTFRKSTERGGRDAASKLAAHRLGLVTQYRYDAVGNLLARTDPDAAQITVVYNARGLHKSVTDELCNVTSYGYDIYGRLRTTSAGKTKTR